MKEILVTVLLLAAVVIIFMSVAGGKDGTEQSLERSAVRMSDSIRRLSP